MLVIRTTIEKDYMYLSDRNQAFIGSVSLYSTRKSKTMMS